MIRLKTGIVEKILWSRKNMQCLTVRVESQQSKAINYCCLTGLAAPGDQVLLNTTAVWMGLGTGGYHFVISVSSTKGKNVSPEGHLIKMRYAPMQIKVDGYEEKAGKKTKELKDFKGLNGCPVIVGGLHSILKPLIITIKDLVPSSRLVYIMTDAACLPLAFSDTVYELQINNLLEGVITCGHAFGGDFETVNVYTALMAAYLEYKPHAIIIAPGPGNVGTGTKYGTTALDQGENINRVNALRGLPIFIPRLSFVDRRKRHFGISHHSLTSLQEIALTPAQLPFPLIDKLAFLELFKTLKAFKIDKKHDIYIYPVRKQLLRLLRNAKDFNTMGRNIKDDPVYFAGIIAAGIKTVSLITKKGVENSV